MSRCKVYWRPANTLQNFAYLGQLPGGGQPSFVDVQNGTQPDVFGCVVRFTVDHTVDFTVGTYYDIEFVYPPEPNDETNEVTDILNALCQEVLPQPTGTALTFFANFVPTH